MKDLIERQAAIDAIEHRLAEPAYQHTGEDWYVGMNCAESEIYELPSVQPEPCDVISRADAIRVASGYCHPANVAEELAKLPSAQTDNSCDGCRYDNADDGVLVPCGFCKRSHPDNYERRTDEQTN